MTRACCLLVLSLSTACGGDDSPGTDVDAGHDSGPIVDAGTDGSTAQATDIFDVWAELQERMQESPDHLPRRADELVSAGDANAIFEFVRDEIAVVPRSTFSSFVNPGWGARATLRSGVGTAHDKAQLLADLLQRAGFAARVGSVLLARDTRDATGAFGSRPARTFAPPVTPEDITRWQEMLDLDALPASTLRIVDPDGSLARGWADTIRAEITPSSPFAPQSEFDGFTPIVEVDIDGTPTAANPLFADAVLGESYASSTSIDDRDFGPYDDVTVRLWARRNHTDARGADITLVEKTFTADQLAGRRVIVRTPPILDFRELILVRPADVGTFLPVIEVSGDGVDDAAQMALNAAGIPINPRGERLEVTDEGDLVIEGVPFPVSEDESALLARVASVSVEAFANSFPEIRLEVDVRDGSDESVQGLSGRAFAIEEDGERVLHRLRRNTATTRVQLLYDNSLSMPAEFRGENAIQLGLDIARDVLMQPGAQLSTAMMENESFEPWVSDMAAFEAQLRGMRGLASSIYSHVAAAQGRDPDLIIVVTDGSDNDTPTPAQRDAIRRGSAPVIVLRTPPGVTDVSEDVAMLTAGQVIPVTARTAAASAIAEYLGAIDKPAYEIRYPAPVGGGTTRDVRASITDSAIEGTTTYEAPEEGSGVFGMTGLYLTVRIDRDEVTRVLAGAPLDARIREPTDADVDAVSEALFGTYVIGFEGAPPPLSVLLDEWLDDALTLRDVSRARGNFEDWVTAMEAGFERPVPELITTAGFARYDNTASHTFVPRLRPIIVSRIPRWGAGIDRRVDVLPLGNWATMGPDPATSFGHTVERSLHVAAVEADMYAMSTASMLEGETLVAVDARTIESRFRGMPLEKRWVAASLPFQGFGQYSAMVPDDGDPVAFWAVNNSTGSTLGVIEDGSGGSYEQIVADVNRNLAFFDMLERAADSGGVSGGVWLALELAKARIVSWATLWIGYLGESGIEPPPGVEMPEEILTEFIRSELEGHAMDALPSGYSDAISDAMEVMGLITDAADLTD